MKRSLIAGLVAAPLLLLGGAAAAFGDIPDSDDGQYHVCVADSGFSGLKPMYAIDAEASVSCPSGYSEKVWGSNPPFKLYVKTESWTGSDSGHEVYCDSTHTDRLITVSSRRTDGSPHEVVVSYRFNAASEPVGVSLGSYSQGTPMQAFLTCVDDTP